MTRTYAPSDMWVTAPGAPLLLDGHWDESERLANYGLTREVERQHRMCAGDFQYILALLAAVRGDDDSNRNPLRRIDWLGSPRGALSLQYASMRARALSAIGQGDFEQAYQFAAAVSRQGYSRHMSARQCSLYGPR